MNYLTRFNDFVLAQFRRLRVAARAVMVFLPRRFFTTAAAMSALTRFNDFVLAQFRRLCIAACAVMVAAISAQVVLRYGFSTGLPWAEELARMAMVFFAFLSAPILYRRGETIAVTALLDRLPPAARAAAAVAIHLLVLLLAAAFVKLSWDFTVAGAKIRASSMPVTMHYVYAVMPVSFLMFIAVAAEAVGAAVAGAKK